MTQPIRPQTVSDTYGRGGTQYASGKLPAGGFRAVADFSNRGGVKKSPTSCPEPKNRIISRGK